MYPSAVEKKIYTVSRLNQEVQRLLETGFGTVWLQGELSNFSRPSSGHFYFSLKDSQAQIRCAMFKGRNRYVDFKPDSGDAVVVRGKLGLYAARGDFQLIVEHMEPAGAGKLQAAFETTKRELDALGWFASEDKIALPALPQTIGVITSPTGAALRDVLQVLKRRCRLARIIIYPTLTQGKAAAPDIAKALNLANARAEADVLLLVRGGGSIEDLWAFNEIQVAEAIRACTLPVVAGIGHEVDITISDLVSDLRAPTPSAAAELATPDTSTLQQKVDSARQNLVRSQSRRLQLLQSALEQQTARLYLRHPENRLREQSQRVDELDQRLLRAMHNQMGQRSGHLQSTARSLAARSPGYRIHRLSDRIESLRARLQGAAAKQHTASRARFELLARTLHSVSPLAVLDRGFAIVSKDGKPVTDVENVKPGEEIKARLANGEIQAIVSTSSSTEV